MGILRRRLQPSAVIAHSAVVRGSAPPAAKAPPWSWNQGGAFCILDSARQALHPTLRDGLGLAKTFIDIPPYIARIGYHIVSRARRARI